MPPEDAMPKSRWWIAPDLTEALERGDSFAEWLTGRIPVASYARISADLSRDAHGVEDQHASNRRHAEAHGLAIVKFCEDNDKTAAKDEVVRDAFNLLVKEITRRRTSGGFHVMGVMCTERERLYRLPGDYERIVKALTVDDQGLLIEDGTRFDLYGDAAEMIGLAGVAQSMREIRKLRERTKRSHASRAQRGQFTGGPRRFGWLGGDKRTDRPCNVYRHPEEWPILLEMIKDAVAGRSWTSMAADLNKRGILTSRGNKWAQASIRALLTNPYICGYRTLNGELVTDKDGRVKIGEWEAPATPEEWKAICERSRQARAQKGLPVEDVDHSPGSPASRHRLYLFSGFLRCGRILDDGNMCNGRMDGSRRKKKDGTYGFFYRCVADGKGNCGRTARNGEQVDRYLTELVLQKLEKQFSTAVAADDNPWPDAQRLELVESKAMNLRKQWREGVVSDDFFYAEFPLLKLRSISSEQASNDTRCRSSAGRLLVRRSARSGRRWTLHSVGQRSGMYSGR